MKEKLFELAFETWRMFEVSNTHWDEYKYEQQHNAYIALISECDLMEEYAEYEMKRRMKAV